jgi:hypothetical protein
MAPSAWGQRRGQGNINVNSVVLRGKNGNQRREKIEIKAKTEMFGDVKAPAGDRRGRHFIGQERSEPQQSCSNRSAAACAGKLPRSVSQPKLEGFSPDIFKANEGTRMGPGSGNAACSAGSAECLEPLMAALPAPR